MKRGSWLRETGRYGMSQTPDFDSIKQVNPYGKEAAAESGKTGRAIITPG
jgi:hypothetical protein